MRFTEKAAKVRGAAGYAARRTRAFGAAAALLVVFGVSLLILNFVTPGPSAPAIAGGITLAVLIGRLIWGRVGAAELSRARGIIDPVAGTGRVLCIGKVKALARVAAIGPIEDRMFEPAVFLAAASTKSPPRKQAVQIITGVAIVALGVWLEHRFMARIFSVYFLFLTGIGGAMLVGTAVYPTYMRIVPGRIDVMECGLLGRRIIAVRRIDLRIRPVLVDLNRQMLEIGPQDAIELIPFAAIWDRWAFAHVVLQAAISSHTPPPLPDDQLVG